MKLINSCPNQALPDGISSAWLPFTSSLAGVLARLKEDRFLIILAKRSNRFVQFAGQGSSGMRAEVVANAFLSPGEWIDEAGLDELLHLGWRAPTGNPESSTPERDPDGSPNYFMQSCHPFDSMRLADLAVRTLRQVLGVPHPGFLEYQAFDTDGKRLSFPGLGLRRVRKAAMPNSPKHLPELLLSAIRGITAIADLEFDEDGDVPVRYGNIVTFTSLATDGSHARIRAALALDVTPCAQVLMRINEINLSTRYLRIVFVGTAIVGVTDVPLVPFVHDHFAAVFDEVCRLGDALSGVLRAEFSGSGLLEMRPINNLQH